MSKYIDADALKNEFKNPKYWINECMGFRLMDIDEVVDKMPAEDVEVSKKWIPCSKELPKSNESVLVWYEYCDYNAYNRELNMIGVGCYFSKQGYWSVEGRCVKCFAWMPLPEPPKMDVNRQTISV